MIFEEKKYNIILYSVLGSIMVIIPVVVLLLGSTENKNNVSVIENNTIKESDDHYVGSGEVIGGEEFIEDTKSKLVINENVSSQDKERIKNLQNIINDNFYLKTNETLQIENKIKEIENDIKKYNQGKIVRINEKTGKEFSNIEEFKKIRIEILPSEISGLEKSLSELKIESFSRFTNPRQEFEKSKNDLGSQISYLKNELSSLKSNTNIEEFYYYSKDEVSQKIKEKENELLLIQKKLEEIIRIKELTQNYKKEIEKSSVEFEMKDLLYVHQTILGNILNEEDMILLDIEKANQILDAFKKQEFVKLTKELAVGVTIESDILYVGIAGDKNKLYFDENFYFSLEKSVKNGYKEFYVYRAEHDKEYDEHIYTFISGLDTKQNYFDTLTYRLLDTNTELLKHLMKEDLKQDIQEKGIFKELVKILQDRTNLTGTSYTKYQVQELLYNSF